MTRNPRPAMTCCWMLVLPMTSSQMNCIRHEQRLGSLLLLATTAAVVLLPAVAVVELLLSSATEKSSWEKRGKRTWIPPIEFRVE